MTDLLSKERLEKIAAWRETHGADSNVMIPAAEAEALVREVLQRREAAEKPFMYGIADPDGKAHFDEFCVSADLGMIEDVVANLNYDREDGDEFNYSAVALYRDHPLTSAERERLAAYDRAAKEPVAWRSDRHGPNAYVVTLAKSVADSWHGKGWAMTPLFTAPPLPVVPDEIVRIIEAHAERLDGEGREAEGFSEDNRKRYAAAMLRGVAKDCRAAMLQLSGNSEQVNHSGDANDKVNSQPGESS
ncbi:hypothetical protein [Pectobacterium aroidearum]|uniref:hypothetical protein n=1 Tax=Pectobacterium aroidearum TaxID=1201031 RepID=UPI003016A6F8